jgi:hypothetical protein
MNITTLRQRLEKLEALGASHAAPQPLHPLTKLLNVLVAYHLGDAGPKDSIAEATARGLGYDGPREFRAALQAQSDTTVAEDRDTRWWDAMRRLFALKGATPDCDGPTFGDTLAALFADMPDSLQHHPLFSPEDRFPEAVYDFLL